MQQTSSSLERYAPLAGIVFLVIGLIANAVIYPDSPDFVDEPAEIAAFYNEEDSSILVTQMMNLISGFFLLWFIGTLAARLRTAEGGNARISGIAFAGGAAAVAMLFAAAATEAVAALRVDEQGSIDPTSAQVYWDLSSALFGLAATMGLGTLLVATAVVALRNGGLPVWFGWITVIVGIGLLIPPIAFFVFFVFLVWVLVASILLFMGGDRGAAAVNQGAATPPAAQAPPP